MRLPPAVALVLCIVAGPALAQSTDLQSRMDAGEFRAFGLHKLDAAELAGLARWIDTQEPAEARLTEAREAGRRDAEQAAPASVAGPQAEPVDSTLVGRFEGYARGREYTLANGQVWKQVGDMQAQGSGADAPVVQIRPARLGGWWLRVGTLNMRARVERIR